MTTPARPTRWMITWTDGRGDAGRLPMPHPLTELAAHHIANALTEAPENRTAGRTYHVRAWEPEGGP